MFHLSKAQMDSVMNATLLNHFKCMTSEQQDEVLYALNKIKINQSVDNDLRFMYYNEFNEVFGDFGEELAISELVFYAGKKELGSVERLKYLTMWYDARVKAGLYEGTDLD